ncbi:MAG: tRNA (N6-threonylcarbamoyladenosine(37)-N6)-methyltransferase TrmO [Actinobacteria bacterium]|nr:tRNA (N6-threonylcarbamoyladenosine(37)-N6)-methyltransferase TrmO [Actinomycetota bacterium]
MKAKITYKQIGIIHSPFAEPKGTPIQPSAAKGMEGVVEVFPEYQKGLKDIERFSHIILIYHFHLSKPYSLEVIPFMDNKPHGLFSTRAPSRPNPIGLSVVRLKKVEENKLHVKDIDIINGTPLLDIKPFIGEFDQVESIKKGWLEKNIGKLSLSRDDERFVK